MQVLIVGAGVAGLSCARELVERGVGVHLIEKSRGVGGRCATRRLEGQPVDHGLAFYHGEDRDFVSALRSVPAEPPLVWPRRIAGGGVACQPRAFREHQQRLAFAAGVTVFPKHLARGLTIDLETRASRIDAEGEALVVETESGRRHRARSVVLALPADQATGLLRTIEPAAPNEVASAAALLTGVPTVRCLTLIATYSAETAPEWDVFYPERSRALQMVSHDSTKRPGSPRTVLVLQGRPRWSAEHWNDERGAWTASLLAAAREVCGEWVTLPASIDTQRWRYARLAGSEALAAPLWIRIGDAGGIGVVGEAMGPGGGVQAAWRSGRRLARRLLESLG